MKHFPRFRGAAVVRCSLLMAVAWLAVGAALSTSAWAQEDRGDRGRRGWRREGGPDRPRPDGERRRSREEREERRDDREAASTAPTSAATTNSFGTASETDRMRKWASDTVAKHDANGDKILEGDELAKLGQSSRGADSNGDGKITVDELYQFSTKSSSASSSSASTATTAKPSTAAATTASGKDAADPKSRIITNGKRKSYRFKSTKDRSNNWRFSSRDANGDGQVSMSEYSRSWNERTASEFLRYDKDGDGMITAAEAP